MPKKVVVATSDHDYYLWQALVQSHSMSKLGFEVDLLVYYQQQPSGRIQYLRDRMPGTTVWMYADDRHRKVYNPAMKPWMLARYLEDGGSDQFYYLDPDCVFTKYPDQHPSPWHGSDTDWYTGPGYIKSKGIGLWLDLCELTGVDPDEASAYRGIGAQYMIAGTTPAFWDEVCDLSVKAYDHMINTSHIYHPADQQYPIQAWCSEMYITNLLAIREGFNPVADPEMSFLWANGKALDWDKHMFFHNAGVTSENGRDFCKISYQVSPFKKELYAVEESASWKYVQLIKETEQLYPDLVW